VSATMTDKAARLLGNTTEDGDCLIWLGGCCNGHPAHRSGTNNALVRRTLWTELRGPIEPGKIIRRTCEQQKCVNPEHMEKTTHKRLGAQLGALGYMGGPVRSAAIARTKRAGPQAKLTDADVLRIRNGDEQPDQLAKALAIHIGTVYRIRRGTHRRDFSSPWQGLGA
jgi:hypothetical protein